MDLMIHRTLNPKKIQRGRAASKGKSDKCLESIDMESFTRQHFEEWIR